MKRGRVIGISPTTRPIALLVEWSGLFLPPPFHMITLGHSQTLLSTHHVAIQPQDPFLSRKHKDKQQNQISLDSRNRKH